MSSPISTHPDFNGWGQVPPQAPKKEKNVVGLIALICAIVGFVFACIKGALIIGWVLLPISFILGIVSLFLRDKKKGTGIAAIIISIIGTVVGFVVFAVVVSDAADEAFGGDTVASSPNDDSAAAMGGENNSADSADGEVGATRDNPLPIGSTVENNDWAYTINSVELNATDKILAENPFNEAPAEGMNYGLVNVTATYKGSDPEGATPWGSVNYVTAEGNTLENAYMVAPDEFDEFATLYEGASITGNIDLVVPAQNAEAGVLAVTPDLTADKKFVAVN